MNSNAFRDLLILLVAVVFSTLLVWIPFILRFNSFWGFSYPPSGMETVWRNFDGLNYIAVAKSFYNPQILQANFSALGLPPIYFASHFPLYPIFISLVSPIFGYLNGMLAMTILFTILAVWMFYFLVKDFNLTKKPLFLSLVFLILPARWVIVRSVGSNEPLFVFLMLATFYAVRKGWFRFAAAICFFALLTRSPAALIFVAVATSIFFPWLKSRFESVKLKFPKNGLVFLFAPISIILLFYFYKIQYGDFLAYFHSGDNIHLTFPLWPVFNSRQFWVGTFWLENIVYVYLLMVAGALVLWRKKQYDLAIFVGLYFIAASFIAHLDIGRYTIPAFPLILIAFENWLTTKEAKIAFMVLLIPIYLFAQNFILGNVSPITDFTFFK